MNADLIQLVVLAQTERARVFSEAFRGGRSEPEMNGFVSIVAAIATLLLVSWCVARLWPKKERPDAIDNPRGLFKALCRAHQLSGASRRALWRLAQEHSPQNPAVVFTTPEVLEARLATSNPRDESLYRQLQAQLFAAAPSSR